MGLWSRRVRTVRVGHTSSCDESPAKVCSNSKARMPAPGAHTMARPPCSAIRPAADSVRVAAPDASPFSSSSARARPVPSSAALASSSADRLADWFSLLSLAVATAAATAAVAHGSSAHSAWGAHSRLRASARLQWCALAMRRSRWWRGRTTSRCSTGSFALVVPPGGRKRQPTAMPKGVRSGSGVGWLAKLVTNVPRAPNRRPHSARQDPSELLVAGRYSLASRAIRVASGFQVVSSAAIAAHARVKQRRCVAVRKSAHWPMRTWPSSTEGWPILNLSLSVCWSGFEASGWLSMPRFEFAPAC